MNRIFVDMDGPLVDYEGYMRQHNLTSPEVKALPGAYAAMDPTPFGLAAVRSLIGMGYDVWIATKPPTGIPHAYAGKVQWILERIPELKRKIIITHDKGLLGDENDFLIDDRPHKANCEAFAGTLIHFFDGTSGHFWPHILEYFKIMKLMGSVPC